MFHGTRAVLEAAEPPRSTVVNKLEPANDNFRYAATDGKFTVPDAKVDDIIRATKVKKRANRKARLRLVYSARPTR
jgi:hypothetical protein